VIYEMQSKRPSSRRPARCPYKEVIARIPPPVAITATTGTWKKGQLGSERPDRWKKPPLQEEEVTGQDVIREPGASGSHLLS
jgi:hypothetical protein